MKPYNKMHNEPRPVSELIIIVLNNIKTKSGKTKDKPLKRKKTVLDINSNKS